MTKIMTSLRDIKMYGTPTLLNKLLASKNKTESDAELFPLSDILSISGLHSCLWAMGLIGDKYKNLRIKYAVWCARRVQNLMRDYISILALDAAWRYSDGEATIEELLDAKAYAEEAVKYADYTADYDDYLCDIDFIKYVSEDTARYAAEAAFLATVCATTNRFYYGVYATALLNITACTQGEDAKRHSAFHSYNYEAEIFFQETKLRQILDAGEWVND